MHPEPGWPDRRHRESGLELKRDLGLYAVFTISLGAMVGSGIFVLPGLGFEIAGPAIVLSYLLAGLAVLPAVFSSSEMATAMPNAGGTYLYVDRAMGPLMGTIAGFGVWFVLIFKAGFALVGLVVRRGFDLVEGGSSAADFCDDLFGGLVPDEGLGVVVPVFGPDLDGIDEVGHAGEHASA